MIILETKDLEELKPHLGKNNLLIACGKCTYLNFDRQKIDRIADELDAGIFNIDRLCDEEDVYIETRGYDTILVFSCGAGVQVASEIVDQPVIPVSDTKSLGTRSNEKIKEMCIGCGNCILERTAGICPLTRCPKGLRNGPCSGVRNTGCELRDRGCVWVKIHDRLKKFDQLDYFTSMNEPKVKKR